MDPKEFFDAGKLDDALAAAIEVARNKPSDGKNRAFLCELFCLTGNLEKADKQLDVLATQHEEATMNIALTRQLIRAEMSRQEFYGDGRLPEFVELPSDAQKLQLEASICLREENTAKAVELLEQAEEARPKTSGVCNGDAFDDFRDLDDLVGASFEVLTSNGKYYWIPVENVISVDFFPPESVRDLMWLRVHMVVKNGPEGDVYLPTLYHGSAQSGDDALRLGRATDWKGDEQSPVRGLGQRTFLVGDADRAILELREIAFENGTS